MDKITIERETLEQAMSVLHEISPHTFPGVTLWRRVSASIAAIDDALSAALAAQPAEQEPVAWLRFQEHADRPTTIHLCDSDHPKAFKVYATLPQPAKPQCSPSQAKSLALLDLDSVEHMQGGANGPTIRLRGLINAHTGPTAPQPPIDNAFVAEGCEQFSQPVDIVNPISQQEPVAWRHSKTGRLYDSVEEVPLADGDEWAEPLYATPATQQAPAAMLAAKTAGSSLR